MVQHPEQLGFKLGLKIHIGTPACITVEMPEAARFHDAGLVYVALLAESSGPLKKGDALKIGRTRKSLKSRWRRTVGIFNRDNLRNYEMNDRRKWLLACNLLLPADVANGKEVSVWMRVAGIPYAGLTQNLFRDIQAEEQFLDQYYVPRVRRTAGNQGERLDFSDRT